jgi:hypothetical protein
MIPSDIVGGNIFDRQGEKCCLLSFKAEGFHHFYPDGIFGVDGTFGT